jgi:zinc transporter ZupT
MEGLPLGSDFLLNDTGKLSFLFGIVLHEFPAAFAMVSILKAHSFNRSRILFFVAIYACMSMLGVLSSQKLTGFLSTHILEYVMAFVVGTFLHIATTILFENSENHKFTTGKVIAILLGVMLAAAVSLTF